MQVTLRTSLDRVLGGRTAAALAAGGIRTVGDLLRHYPRRFHQRGELTALSELREGENATIFAEIANVRSWRARSGRRVCEVTVTDGRQLLVVTFFNLKEWMQRRLAVGTQAYFAGTVTRFKGRLQMVHPEIEFADAEGDPAFAGAIVPLYAGVGDLPGSVLRRSIRTVLDVVDLDTDPLPPDVRARHRFVGLREAFEGMHRPTQMGERHAARRRLAFEEAFVLQVALAVRRRTRRRARAIPRRRVPGGLLDAFDAALPFPLTDGQRRAGAEIEADLAADHPMHRLLHGEVGSGKTLVALRAMLTVVDAGGQAVLLAPTEVLAQQHFRSISHMLGPLGLQGQLGGSERATRIALLTGSLPPSTRRQTLDEVARGDVGIIVGTHALLGEEVRFADLGLVVVDEQHRFGVEQRAALRAKSAEDVVPHLLVMTATPIPRTIALTIYGDLDTSVLRERPSGDPKIETFVVPLATKPEWSERVWQRVREEVAVGHRVYVICPRIGGDQRDPEDGEDLPDVADPDASSRRPPAGVIEVAAALREGPLRDLRVGVLHGQLPAAERDGVMRSFAGGGYDVLVATTIVEVGVDVPEASMIVILDADRFGISQLHQLRGRVGRDGRPSLALLVTEAEPGSPAFARLEGVARSCDGFALAELDLEQRGEGTLRDVAQHGRSDFALLSLLRDRDLIELARDEAARLVDDDPELKAHPALGAAVGELLADERLRYLEMA
ncbi:MAG: ATP-dependent DNA helicase RecG [Acidothermus sp.]|nr:ATP-dependent DNA helicase RecG [Acidothermus sp.]